MLLRENRINVYLEPDQRTGLRRLAAQTGESESKLIRRAVVHLLRNSDFFVPPDSRGTQVILLHESEKEGAA